jgi:hypothetical protein
MERLREDASLRDFVAAEITRAGIELDTVRWQRDHFQRCLAALTTELEATEEKLRVLQRRLGKHGEDLGADLLAVPGGAKRSA